MGIFRRAWSALKRFFSSFWRDVTDGEPGCEVNEYGFKKYLEKGGGKMAIVLRIAKFGEDIDDSAAPALDSSFIDSVEFTCETMDSTKGRSATQRFGLVIEGSINYSLKDGVEHPLDEITAWAGSPAEDPETYRKIQVDVIASDQVVRRYIFPDTFVMAYEEEMNEKTGRGKFKLVLREKADVGKNIDIKNPFKAPEGN